MNLGDEERRTMRTTRSSKASKLSKTSSTMRWSVEDDEPPMHWKTGRKPFGELSRLRQSSEVLYDPPVFGKGTKGVRLTKYGTRGDGLAVFVSRKKAERELAGKLGPGPIYRARSDFGDPPPLPEGHFLVRTSPLRRLGVGSAAEERLSSVREERRARSPLEMSARARIFQIPPRRFSPELDRPVEETDPTVRFGKLSGSVRREWRWPKRSVRRDGTQDPYLPPWIGDIRDERVSSALQSAARAGVLPPGPPLGRQSDSWYEDERPETAPAFSSSMRRMSHRPSLSTTAEHEMHLYPSVSQPKLLPIDFQPPKSAAREPTLFMPTPKRSAAPIPSPVQTSPKSASPPSPKEAARHRLFPFSNANEIQPIPMDTARLPTARHPRRKPLPK